MIKRSDIRGCTIKLFGYSVEFVTCKHVLCTIAISKNNRTIRILDK